MRRAAVFLCAVAISAAIPLITWHTLKDNAASASETAALQIKASKNTTREDAEAILAALLERPKLDEISARLALPSTWSMDAERTVERLRNALTVSLHHEKSVVSVSAIDNSAVASAALANTAASVLRDYLEGIARKKADLDDSIRDQRDVVEDKRKSVASLRRTAELLEKEKAISDKEIVPEKPRKSGDIKLPEAHAMYFYAEGDLKRAEEELERMEDQRREVKEVVVHRILWAEAKPRE